MPDRRDGDDLRIAREPKEAWVPAALPWDVRTGEGH